MLFHQEPVYKNISISILDRIAAVLLKPEREREIAKRQIQQLQIRPPVAGLDLGMPMAKMMADITVVQISLRPIFARIGAPGSVPGAPSPSSCWLRTPNGSVTNNVTHHRTK